MTRGRVPGVRMAGVGVCIPERVLTNDEISRRLDTSDEWIRTRTGIRERRLARSDQAPSDLATEAGAGALRRAGVDAGSLDLVISSSLVPDMVFPATAALVADRLGARSAGAFDVQAGCAGFMYALATGAAFIGAGTYRSVLVLGSEVASRCLDWEDRSTCILFGDGAGAVVLLSAPEESVLTFDLGSDGAGWRHLNMPAGGARMPASERTVRERQHYLKMDGREIYRFATRTVTQSCAQVLKQAGLTAHDVDLFVPHQANLRIVEHIARDLGFCDAQLVTNLDRFGNTSCASIPLCLAEAEANGRLQDGARLLLAGFGAGLCWGSCVATWGP